MSVIFRLLLMAGAVFEFILVIRMIRKSAMSISDSIFWFGFAFLLLLLAAFPGIAFLASELLGIESPVNLVYLVIIALLIHRVFKLYVRLSEVNDKLTRLAQDLALRDHEEK